jgi:hypothetical protein
LAELALEIEAEFAGAAYNATPDELTAIDEGLAGEAASEEVKRYSRCSGRREGRIFESSHRRSSTTSRLLRPVWQRGRRCKNRSPHSRGRRTNSPIAFKRTTRRSEARRSRRAVLSYRYKIFYRVIGDSIRVVHIRHTSRRPYD